MNARDPAPGSGAGTDVHLTIRNQDGSVEHYYHFLLGFFIPLLKIRLDLLREGGVGRILVRGCGIMDHILRATRLPELEIVDRALHAAMRTDAEKGNGGQTPRCLEIEGYDDPDRYASADFATIADWLRRHYTAELDAARAEVDRRFTGAGTRILLIERGEPDPYYASDASERQGGGSQRRSIPNFGEIHAALQATDADLLVEKLEGLSLWRQMALFEAADVVIAQHGAALANLIWGRPALRVVEILPMDRRRKVARDHFGRLARIMGQSHRRVEQSSAHAPVQVARVLAALDGWLPGAQADTPATPGAGIDQGMRGQAGTVSLEKAVLTDLCLGVPLGGLLFEHARSVQPDPDIPLPNTLIFRGEQLRLIRHLHRHGDPLVRDAVESLVRTAEASLDAGPFAVTDKREVPAGVDPHDYVSPAKYWWPNPHSADGLPYVRRDGEVNPACHSDASDNPRLVRLSETVLVLALAAWLTDRPEFSARACSLLDTWFVDPRTRQTPHFRFAQHIPGRDVPRGEAMIEARHLVAVTEAVLLLEASGTLPPSLGQALRDWHGRLLDWMRGSEAGLKAASADNNIGFWYDLQCLVYANFRGQADMVDSLLRNDVIPRITAQIAPDGSLPAELVRARPYDYVAFTLIAMALISRAGESAGLALWDYREGDGASFRMAHDWLLRAGGSDRLVAGLLRDSGRDPDQAGVAGSSGLDVAMRLRLVERLTETHEKASAAMTAELAQRNDQIKQLREEIKQLEKHGHSLERKYRAIQHSASWRATAPFRALAVMIRSRKLADAPPPGLRSALKWIGLLPGFRNPSPGKSGMPESLRLLHASKPDDEAALQLEYHQKGLDHQADTFVLYRIVGNDLHPRHRRGQSLENLRFILENEPVLEGCEKRWVLNRIVDPFEESAIAALLDRHDMPYLRIPFDPAEYRRVPLDRECLPDPAMLDPPERMSMQSEPRLRALAATYRLRNNYIMNNNGARNTALRDGRGRAKWVLPWDGNCYLTGPAWQSIRAAILERPHLKYFVVPMARVTDHARLKDDRFIPVPLEEPQILFRKDAKAEFDERYCYGRRPKVELFWRLGVPGLWDRWIDDPWDLPRNPEHPEARQFGVAGWVVRLFSGMKQLEQHGRRSWDARGIARRSAIISMIDAVDRLTGYGGTDNQGLTCYRLAGLECLRDSLAVGSDTPAGRLARSLIADADRALARGPYSVIDKTSLPPSGNRHDYWHPAPYWWPDPGKPDGLPYIQRDGERVPGTRMYEADSERYDRTRLQHMFDDTTLLALAWAVAGNRRHAEHAARLIRTWFVDPDTRMNPHLGFAQVRMGHDGNAGQSTGIIEFKDLYYFLDAVRLTEQSGALSDADRFTFRFWLTKYLDWLLTSPQGQGERQARNNHGTYYDLQVGAIAAYLNDENLLTETIRRATERVREQFAADGSQPHELRRKTSAHYCLFNLQGWLNLAHLAGSRGSRAWGNGANARLESGLRWLFGHMGKTWPYQQIDEFDSERYYPILHTARCAGLSVPAAIPGEIVLETMKPRFFPHDGVHPYWNVPCHGDAGGSR